MKKQIPLYIAGVLIAVIVIVAGISTYQSNVKTNALKAAQELTATTKAKGISYSGKDGLTALELLKQNATVLTTGTGENAYVTSINDVVADSSKNQFWAFYINGESATVGAGSYTTNSSDKISWKFETF